MALVDQVYHGLARHCVALKACRDEAALLLAHVEPVDDLIVVVAPSLPTQAHVGNAVAFVSAACSWFDEKRLDMPLDEHLAEAIRSAAGALVFAGERKVSPEEAEKLAEEFQAEDGSHDFPVQMEGPGERAIIRLPREAWQKIRETLELDSRSSAFDPELRKEIREALDQVERARARNSRWVANFLQVFFVGHQSSCTDLNTLRSSRVHDLPPGLRRADEMRRRGGCGLVHVPDS